MAISLALQTYACNANNICCEAQQLHKLVLVAIASHDSIEAASSINSCVVLKAPVLITKVNTQASGPHEQHPASAFLCVTKPKHCCVAMHMVPVDIAHSMLTSR